MPRCATRRQERVMAGIVAGMAHHVRMRPADEYISYSRDHSRYPGQEIYYGADWGYGPVVSSIDKLADSGWMLVHDRKKQQAAAIGQQSRFLPDPAKFKGVLLPKTQKSLGEIIRLRDRKERVLIPYKNTEAVARMRRSLEKINAHLRDAEIRFEGGVRRNGSIVYFENIDEQDGRLKTAAVDLDDVELYRVFSGSWSLGGRYYGGAWQGVPKGERKHFFLDGERVVEHDYKNNHPSILYIAEGKPLDLDSDYDAYDILGFRDQRTACKRALNIMLNARRYGAAVGSVKEHVASQTYEEAKELVEAVKIKHETISGYFFSDVGLKLQRLDAEICGEVLKEMTVKRGVTCLPLHDSFMVPASAADELVRVMSWAFNKNTANVTNTSFSSKTSASTILNTGACCGVVVPVVGVPGSADSDSESEFNGQRNRRGTIRTAASAAVRPSKRFDRLRRKPVESTIAVADEPAADPVLTVQEKAQEKPVGRMESDRMGHEAADARERTLDPSIRTLTPHVPRSVKGETALAATRARMQPGWRPKKTTTLQMIRAEEARRDARNHRRVEHA